jgi:putative membrane protein
MSLLVSWLILSVAVWVTAAILPGIHVKSFAGAAWAAAVFAILNTLLGWLLFAVFSVATLGIAWLLGFVTRWIINAILLLFTGKLTDALEVKSFGSALLGALIISITGAALQWVLR